MMGTVRMLVAFALALLLAVPGMAWADLSAGAAFQQGQAAASGGAAATGSVNATGAAGNVPGYTDAPKEAQQWGGGTVSLSGPGLGKQAGCITSDISGYGGKECDAINFLGNSRPQYPLQSNDALFNLSHGITSANRDSIAGMTGGNGTGGCTTLEVTDPDLQSTEHCQEWLEPTDNQCTVGRVVEVDRDANYQCDKTVSSLETQKCRRGFSVTVGSVVAPESFDVNRGSEVPTWSARTFTMNFHVNGVPDKFTLDYYRVDNYGQLWVNGTLVYQNSLYGSSDMRWGSVGYITQTGTDYEGNTYSYSTISYKNQSGSSLGWFYDDGCNSGCRGLSPNRDITRYVRQGDNEIVLVCANANDIGPCSVKITGSAKELVVLGSLVDNQCATLEARAK